MSCAGHVEVGELILQEDEVEEVKWINFEELKKLLYSDKWVPMDKECKHLIIENLEKV